MLWHFIKSETYRAVKLKTFYILPAVMVVFTLLIGITLMRMDMMSALGIDRAEIERLSEMGNSVDGWEESMRMGYESGLNMGQQNVTGDSPAPEELFGIGIFYYDDVPEIFHQNITTLDQLVYLAIFAGMFVGDIYTSGNDKNIIIGTRHRLRLFSARVIVLAGYTLAMHILRFFAVVFSVLIMGESVKWNLDRSFWMYFFITYLLSVAFICLVSAIANVTRSKAASITIGVLLASGMLSFVTTLFDFLVNKLFAADGSFSIAEYLLTQNLTILSLDSDGAYVFKTVIVGLVYLILSVATSVFVIRKRDVV